MFKGLKDLIESVQETIVRAKIGDLPANPACSAVYRRADGEIWLRLNDDFHVRGEAGETPGNWIANGVAEKIDHAEMVEVIYDRTSVKV